MDPIKWWTILMLRYAQLRRVALLKGDYAAYLIVSGRMGTLLTLIQRAEGIA